MHSERIYIRQPRFIIGRYLDLTEFWYSVFPGTSIIKGQESVTNLPIGSITGTTGFPQNHVLLESCFDMNSSISCEKIRILKYLYVFLYYIVVSQK